MGAGVAGAFGAVVLGLVCVAGGLGGLSVGAQGAVAVTVLGRAALLEDALREEVCISGA